jgi:hypothetical protein
VLDSSLVDVKNCVSPQFDIQDIQNLNKNSSLARDVYGVNYLPGIYIYICICIYTYIYIYIYVCVYMYICISWDIPENEKYEYYSGFVGLNNLKNTDYVNVILHIYIYVYIHTYTVKY